MPNNLFATQKRRLQYLRTQELRERNTKEWRDKRFHELQPLAMKEWRPKPVEIKELVVEEKARRER